MAADIFRLVKGFPHWLPGNTEIICILVIPDINIVAWPVHRDTVSAKTADAVIFRAFVKRISSCRVIKNRGKVLHPQIIRPGRGNVHPVNDIFPFFVIKISVSHR